MGLRLRFWVLAILMDTGWMSSQKLPAAEGTAAHAQAADHLGLVPDADLPELDAGAEHRGQILDQLPGSPPRPSAVKKNRILLPSKAHSADTSCMSRPWAWIFCWQTSKARFSFCSFSAVDALVLLGGQAQHPPQRRHDVLARHGMVARGADSVFMAPGGVD